MTGTEIESVRTALKKSVLYLPSGFEFITVFDQLILKDRKFVTEKD
jgi:hypothetical protein